MEEQIQELLNSIPQGVTYTTFPEDLLPEDISQERIEGLKKLLTHEDVFIELCAAQLLCAWGIDEGFKALIQLYEAGEAGFFSPKQEVAFEQFFYHNSYREQLKEQLRDFYEELVNEGELERKNTHHFELDFEFVAIPSQCKTSKNIVYVGAFTNWDREDSEFPLEVEIYFEEGEVMWIDELHGNYIFPH